MWIRNLLILSNVLIVGLLGWLLFMNRKPPCIDSKYVEKIDVVTARGPEEVWSCYQRKSVPFSPYFDEMLHQISGRLKTAESVFLAVGYPRKRLRLEILLQKPWAFEIIDNSIYIGEALFRSEGHLEKALFKAWYRQREPDMFAHSRVNEEVFTDLMLFLATSDVNIEDRLQGYKTKIDAIRWPQNLKTIKSYCASPWKASEHYDICEKGKNLQSFLSEQLMELSMRPLLSAAVIDSYRDLTLQQKNDFLSRFGKFISSKRSPPLDVLAHVWEAKPPAVVEGRRLIQDWQEFLMRAPEVKSSESLRSWSEGYLQSMRRKGLHEATSEVHFDYIYELEKPLDKQSSIYKQLARISEANKDQQIAIMDPKNIWFLPAAYPMERELFKDIRSQHRIVEKCGPFNFEFILSYKEESEKLMVIESCGKDLVKSLSSYFDDGPEGFARHNRGVSFVQFHLPSLLLKSEAIPTKENIVSLMKNPDMKSPVLQALGWQELGWEQKVEAYKPAAAVQAIQWFRF